MSLYDVIYFICLILILLSAVKPKLSNLPFIYIVIMGISAMIFTKFFVPVSTDESRTILSAVIAKSLLFTVAVMMIPRRVLIFFPIVAILNSLWVIFYKQHYGIGMATSVDAMLIAIMYPSILKFINDHIEEFVFKVVLMIIPIVAIFTAKGSVGIGGLSLALFILYARPGFYKFLLLPISLFTLYYFIDPLLFSDSLRFVCWRWSMHWWWDNANHWIGTGMGTFSVLGPYIQSITQQQIGNWYIEMHNDWLQLLFEFGYIGLSVVLSFVTYVIYKARHDRHLLASIVTYSACALFYYPTKNVFIASFGMLLVKDSLEL